MNIKNNSKYAYFRKLKIRYNSLKISLYDVITRLQGLLFSENLYSP